MKTHRERAREAWRYIESRPHAPANAADIIARQTFPTELVAAARAALHSWGIDGEDLFERMDDLEEALAAYEETP